MKKTGKVLASVLAAIIVVAFSTNAIAHRRAQTAPAPAPAVSSPAADNQGANAGPGTVVEDTQGEDQQVEAEPSESPEPDEAGEVENETEVENEAEDANEVEVHHSATPEPNDTSDDSGHDSTDSSGSGSDDSGGSSHD